MMEIFTDKTLEEVVREQRKNIGKLYPVTDTRFRSGKPVLIKYADHCHNIRTGEDFVYVTYEMAENFTEGGSPAEMWYTCGEYEICKEDNIIGWLPVDMLDEVMSC